MGADHDGSPLRRQLSGNGVFAMDSPDQLQGPGPQAPDDRHLEHRHSPVLQAAAGEAQALVLAHGGKAQGQIDAGGDSFTAIEAPGDFPHQPTEPAGEAEGQAGCQGDEESQQECGHGSPFRSP